MNQPSFEFIEHPADIKVRAFGHDLEELYANAARAMFHYLYSEDEKTLVPDREEMIQVCAHDLESLLVEWLSELLFLSNTNYRAYVGYSRVSVTPSALSAVVASCAASASDDIKAVTYHDLAVRRCGDHWEATVTFDI